MTIHKIKAMVEQHMDLDKAQQIIEQGAVAVSGSKAVSTSVVTAWFASISGLVTKENTIFVLTAVLLLTQIVGSLYKQRLYKKLSTEEHLTIDPEDLDEVMTKRIRKNAKKMSD